MILYNERDMKEHKNSTIQIRISPDERHVIDKLQEMPGGFNLSDFVRKSLHAYGKIKGIQVNQKEQVSSGNP